MKAKPVEENIDFDKTKNVEFYDKTTGEIMSQEQYQSLLSETKRNKTMRLLHSFETNAEILTSQQLEEIIK